MLTLFSPAKVNLFLRVVGRRPDGYHDLSSLFQTISLGDTLSFQLAETDSLTCTDKSLPVDGTNLVMKAVELFRRKTGLRFGVKIHLDKKIPSQAGLGGGSSNAATTLWALNRLLGDCVAVSELQAWSAEIGSDIPFFFSQGTAYCTGRGEVVEDVGMLGAVPLTIVKPPIGLPTPAVYARLRTMAPAVHRTAPREDLELFLRGKPHYFNDLEAPAFAQEPTLAALKEALKRSGYKTVLMTGSGSAFFCIGKGTATHLYQANAVYVNRPTNQWY